MKKVWKGLTAAAIAASLGASGFIGISSAYAVEGDDVKAGQSTSTTTGQITADEHSYNVYQIFKGSYFNGTLSNVEAGANYKGEKTEAAVKAALAELEALHSDASNAAKLAVITKYVNLSTPKYTVEAGKTIGVEAGYYILEDSTTLDKGDAKNLYVAMVAGGDAVTVTRKRGTVTSDKYIKDLTNGVESDWQKAADHAIGDTISYKLVANLPDNVEEFKNAYKLTFVDDMSEGLTYKKGSAKITVTTGTETTYTGALADPATAKDSAYTNGNKFQWVFDNIKADPYKATNNSVVTIEYSATLNEKAVVTNAGNPNKSHVVYSSNPNVDSDTNTTPDKTAITFTYQTTVNKVDKNNNALEGADFTLFRVVDGKEVDFPGVKTTNATDDTKATTFNFKGLDDGTYVLRETTTPDGYNTIKPIKFTVTDGHLITNGTSDDWVDPVFTQVKSSDFYELDLSFGVTPNTGVGSVNIVNEKGSELPSTGGMGTVVLYTVGGLIVLIAGVGLAVALRRRQA